MRPRVACALQHLWPRRAASTAPPPLRTLCRVQCLVSAGGGRGSGWRRAGAAAERARRKCGGCSECCWLWYEGRTSCGRDRHACTRSAGSSGLPHCRRKQIAHGGPATGDRRPRGLPPPPAAVQAAHSAHCSVSEVSGPKVAVEFPHAWVSIEPFRLLRCDHSILRLPLQH
jgi:hypothetical protein